MSHRNPPADGQTTATEIRSVPDLRASHGSVADRAEAGRRDTTATQRNQSDSGGARSDGGRLRRRRPHMAPRRGAGLRAGQILSLAGRLLQRQ